MKHKVCSWSELVSQGKVRVLVNERPILVVAHTNQAYAISDKCPHKGMPLSPGKCEGGIIRCKEHGLQVDVTTGMVVPSPKAKFLVPNSDQQTVKIFKTSIANGDVYIEV
ncbi:MAG: Rieske 2Fe-2S domain-containing protein [Bacilli bacterium]